MQRRLVQPGQIITSEEFIGIMTEKYCDAESLESGISIRYLLHRFYLLYFQNCDGLASDCTRRSSGGDYVDVARGSCSDQGLGLRWAVDIMRRYVQILLCVDII